MNNIVFIIIELILADLILGGDNAIVIAMATKELEDNVRKKATFIGAFLAIILRVIFVIIIMIIGELHIIFLNIIAGGLLIYIALGLIGEDNEEHNIKKEKSLFKAVKTIVVADAIMSLDNAIIIATIASSANLIFGYEIILIVVALFFSFPIILFGANILSKLIQKFKFVIYIFTLLLLHTAIHMILKDKLLVSVYAYLENGLMNYVIWFIAITILMLKVYKSSINKKGKVNNEF